MRPKTRIGTWLPVVGLTLALAGPTAAGATGKQIFVYKGQPGALSYQIDVKTLHKVVAHRGGGWRGKTPQRSHHEVIGFDLRSLEKDDGTVLQTLTFTSINGKGAKLWGRQGDTPVIWLNREQLVGNSQSLKMDPLGRVVEAQGAPHFMSPSFYPKRSPDGPPLDMYRILTMVFPRFPLRRISVGDSWRVKDTYTVVPAREKNDAKIQRRPHKLDAKIRRNLRMTLKGFVRHQGVKVARIAFRGRYSGDLKGIEPNNGHYETVAGKTTGEFLFDPAKGMIVSADFQNKYNYSYATDGVLVGYFLSPKERISLLLEDDTTPAVPWLGEQSIHLELKRQTASVSPRVKTASR